MAECPYCHSTHTHRRGKDRRQCNNCRRYFTHKESYRQLETDILNGTGVVTGRVPKHLTESELMEYFQIDPAIWEITKIVYIEHEGYRKDRKVAWEVRNGKVTYGSVQDSGKLRIEPLIGVKVHIRKRFTDIHNGDVVKDLIREAKKFSPKYPKLHYKKIKDPVLYEIQLPDLQLGRMVMASEVGYELTPDIAVEAARTSVLELLNYVHQFPVEKIVFPIGHDFFDANHADGFTAHGTFQRDDPRWQRTYKLGKGLLIELIDRMSALAPVDVPVIVGNHDEERMFYMGDTLESWYSRNPNVSIDNAEKKRKYRLYGKCLLGFTHGYHEKISELPGIMAAEVPELWATAKYREWHVGDKHHLEKILYQPIGKESMGTVVRILRSPATPSVWEYDKGFFSLQACESFVWHPLKGQIAQFTA